jgi:hypothetical protein
MRRSATTAGRVAAACVSAAALLTGCGVSATGVVEAGGAATVAVSPSPGQRLLLFFITPEGRVRPVARLVGAGGDAAAKPVPLIGAKALSALFAGPRPDESAAGLRTELPSFNGPAAVKGNGHQVLVRLPLAIRQLTASAVRQVVCTAAYAQSGDGTAKVTIRGNDEVLPPAVC